MTRQLSDRTINIGTQPNDNTGDTLREAFRKSNDNFAELYANTDAGVVHPTDLTANLANYTTTEDLVDLIAVSSVNNSLYLGGTAAASYQLNSTLGANIASYLPSYTGVVNGSSIAVTGAATIGGAATVSGNLTVTGNLNLTGATIFTNAIAITTNDKYIILANNAATSAAADGTGIVAATFANIVYKNSGTAWQSNVNFTPAANNLGLGNTTSVWNVYSNNINSDTIFSNTIIANTTINPSSNNRTIGNTTAIWNIYSNNIWAVSANVSGQINTASILVGSNVKVSTIVEANTLGIFTTLQCNSANLTVGTNFIANTLGMYHTGAVNAATGSIGTKFTVDSTNLNFNSNFIANTLGITHTGFINVASANVTTNTLNLGTYTSGANGYTYLPNGLKMNWGWVSSNTTNGDITFSSAYTTNAYNVTATSNTPGGTYVPAVISWVKTGASIRTTNTTSTNVFWHAIGT